MTENHDKPLDSLGAPADQLADSVGYLVARTRQLILAHLSDETLPMGLTGTQAIMLYKIKVRANVTAADLAREHSIDASAITRLLDRLEKRGLLVRVRDKTDRRAVLLSLTEEGTAIAIRFTEIYEASISHLLRGFNEGEVGQFKDFMRRIIANSETK